MFASFFANRLKEASTWRGIVAIATALGVTLSPEQQAAIIGAGLALMGIIGAFTPDHKKPVAPAVGYVAPTTTGVINPLDPEKHG